MNRLFLRIYVAVLASLVVFAVLTGLAWRLFADFERFGPQPEFFQAAADQLAPQITLTAVEQHAALARWRALSGFDLALFGADGQVLADASDGTLPAQIADSERRGPRHWRKQHWAQVVPLTDGRWLVAAWPRAERQAWRRFGWLAVLGAILAAVGISAYPVVRRLTRRLEVLQSSVAALGSGNLAARVPVEGTDEIARLAETFNRSAARIEALVTANTSLLANASHELRSPLARLRMGIETITRAGPSAASEAQRSELARNIQELDQLIEEILLSSRLGAQPVDTTKFETVDLVALIAEECARGSADLTVSPTTTGEIQGDARLLRRLIRNLLENAHRYGGGTAVEVFVEAPTVDTVRIDICDRGKGVPDAARERIFEPFYRLPGASEQDGGVGLGLALVRQIAAQHGGRVMCLPRDGGGSRFWVELKGRT